MFQQETKITEMLSQLDQDKEFISERQKDRQERYKKSTQLFLKSIQKEMTLIEKSKESNDKRNQEFQNQIKDLYTRYQAGTQTLVYAQRKTTNAKIQFNNDILQFYPRLLRDQRSSIEQHVEDLKKRLDELKQINQRENYDYYKILDKKYEGFSIKDDIKNERERLENELNETKKFLRPNPAMQQQQQNQDQNFAKSQPQFLQQYDAKYYKNQNTEDEQFSQTMKSNNAMQQAKTQQQFHTENQQQQQNRQQQYNPYQQEGVKNFQQYTGLQQQIQNPTIQREEAQDLLNQFMQPDLSKKNRMNNYRPVVLSKINQSENNSALKNGNMQEIPRDNEFSVQKVPYQGGFRQSRAMSKETFPESTEKQSSQPSEQREDYYQNKNINRNQEYQ